MGTARARSWSLAVLLALTLAIIAAPDSAAQMHAGRSVELAGQRTGQQFAAGDNVYVTAQVADDIFVAGRVVTLEGARAQSLIVGAGSLMLRNSTVHDLIAGSLGVEIHGQVEDDAVVAVCPICWWGTRQILIGRDGRIGDEALLVAETIQIDGSIGGTLQATARRIVISGSVTGRADLKANEIVLTPTARLGGELIARSPGSPQIAAGASITGPVREIPTRVDFPVATELPRQFAWMAGLLGLGVVLGVLLLAALVQGLLPGLVQSGADRLALRPWPQVGVGLIVAVLTPMLASLLTATIIGAPVALVVVAAFFVLAALAFVTASYAGGLWLRRRMTAGGTAPTAGGRIGWTLLGALILVLINIVPLLGWITFMLLLLGGIGAAASVLADRLRPLPAPPPQGSPVA